MATKNAFMVGLEYSRKTDAPAQKAVKKVTNARWTEEKWKWSIITNSEEIRAMIMEELAKLGEDGYGPTTRYFINRNMDMIDVPYEIMRKVSSGESQDFVILNKVTPSSSWAYSKKYTSCDLSAYFGARFQGTYKTTGQKQPPKKVL